MTSLHSSTIDTEEVDLTGLVESVVDSDEEDLVESMENVEIRDLVRDSLEKDPSERNEHDIEVLLGFTQNLKAFTNMTLTVRRALCSVLVFAVVEKTGTVVMNDGEELDSWSVLINGIVEVEKQPGGVVDQLQYGDSFGILPTMEKAYHNGIMRTKTDDCHFICITQTDYYRILHEGEGNIKKHEENGKVVLVTEFRATETIGKQEAVVIRGTPERLMIHLIEENSINDPTYVEDFLLTHRTFIDSQINVASKLLEWFRSDIIDDFLKTEISELTSSTTCQIDIKYRVARVVILWVNNYFTDFETDCEMMRFLEDFEMELEKNNMIEELKLLHIAHTHKARTRTLTLTKERGEDLHFKIIGGYEKGGGIFVLEAEKNSKATEIGLRRGDQILEVNGQNFDHVSNIKALEILTGTTHLSIIVKSNMLVFRELLNSKNKNSSRLKTKMRIASDLAKLQATDTRIRISSVDLLTGYDVTDNASPLLKYSNTFSKTTIAPLKKISDIKLSSCEMGGNFKNGGSFVTLGPKKRIQKALQKLTSLARNTIVDEFSIKKDESQISSSTTRTCSFPHSPSHTLDKCTPSEYIESNSKTTVEQEIKMFQESNNHEAHQKNSTREPFTFITPIAQISCGEDIETAIMHSHSDIPKGKTIYFEDTRSQDYPENILKVFKPDQTYKFLLVHKETTAHEVVMLSLQEFGIHDPSSNFSLCEVSVGEGGMVKHRRLPDHLQNLAEQIGLSSRYYLKTNGISENLVPDELISELIRESNVCLLQLNPKEVAIQLTNQDFYIFRQIESTEYIDDLFSNKSNYGTKNLKKFSELVNKEMFWVVSEICREQNIVRRSKIIKQFIKIALHCKESKNFNSVFAIVSGLGHTSVSRLRLTWEKLSTKYQRLFKDLQDLMDPSRNMSKYRQLIAAELAQKHSLIPFYPVVKKDLTFIHLGNDTRIEGLINFEKLRMISKEVRCLMDMCSSSTPYLESNILSMLDMKSSPNFTTSAMSQISTTLSSSIIQHGSATVKRRKKSGAIPNPKKMFEEAQMNRKVKAYLNKTQIIQDEKKLESMSKKLECEPAIVAPTHNTVSIRKRQPSPTLSTTSSTSSKSDGIKAVGPKFGTASPKAVKKILSLAENSKTRPERSRLGLNFPPGTGLSYQQNSQLSNSSPSPGSHRRILSTNGRLINLALLRN